MKLTLSIDDQIWEQDSDNPKHALWQISNRMNAVKVPKLGQPRGEFHNVRFGLSYMLEIGESFEACAAKLKEHGFTVQLEENH